VRIRSFPAVIGRSPKLLILGTLPGIVSLKLTQYYGHPQNKFWELLGSALDLDLRSMTYPRRLKAVKARGVALWDVVADARRAGSLDAAIKDERHNDVLDLIRRRRIRAVFFNGRVAMKMYERRFGKPTVPAFLLPSSSPAYASVPFKAKARGWRRLRAYL
jgi:hypoxanthine-DNA glycosylase